MKQNFDTLWLYIAVWFTFCSVGLASVFALMNGG